MEKYKIVTKGFLQSMSKFEIILNELHRKNYRAVSMTRDPNGKLVVLMEKQS